MYMIGTPGCSAYIHIYTNGSMLGEKVGVCLHYNKYNFLYVYEPSSLNLKSTDAVVKDFNKFASL